MGHFYFAHNKEDISTFMKTDLFVTYLQQQMK